MHETPEELAALQELLDRSMASAGPHLSGIIDEERRLSAEQVADRLQGMFIISLATVTADGRPLAGPVDGYLLHGDIHFSTGADAIRLRHIHRRPAVTATYVPGEELAVTVHGRAHVYDMADPDHLELRQAMLDHYLPRQGPAFEEWLDGAAPVGVRIQAERIFTFHL